MFPPEHWTVAMICVLSSVGGFNVVADARRRLGVMGVFQHDCGSDQPHMTGSVQAGIHESQRLCPSFACSH